MLAATGCIYTEINATMYSETGYSGLDLSSSAIGFYQPPWLLSGEKRSAMTPLAERWGVVVIDEFDKIMFKKTPDGRDTGRALQAELLRITEGDTVYARARDNEMGTAFNTHHVLFLAMGAFEGLSRIVDPSVDGAYVRAEPYHIQRYGFMEELVGRFSTIVALPPLKEDHMYRIIVEHIWPNWVQMAADEGIALTWSDEALRLFANQACQRGIGARGLEPLIEAALWKAWGTVGKSQEIWLGPECVATGAVARERDAVPV
jgi:ATP-dependent Clp protease ATP-binding subunit ClpX